jgi:uncharacterized membrane protein (DUF485 family)
MRRLEQVAEIQQEKSKVARPGERRWVVPCMLTALLLGVIWIVVSSIAGTSIPFMAALASWNIVVGIVLIAAAFVLMTFWK